MIRSMDFSAIKISLASPDKILAWSHGEVLKPETINYRTFKAEKDGLFCERIFGPTKDFECYCGKYKRVRYKGVICDKCGVEVTYSRVRRDRMGHIKLAAPCAHVWFFRRVPSQLALLLNISPRNLDAAIYFSSHIIISLDRDKKAQAISKLGKDALEEKKKIHQRTLEEIKKQEEKSEKEIKKISVKDKTQKELIEKEIELKKRKAIASLRDKEVSEQEEAAHEFNVIEAKLEQVEKLIVLTDAEYQGLGEYLDVFAKVGMGAEAIKEILMEIDIDDLAKKLRRGLKGAKTQKRVRIAKRLKVVEGFQRARVKPEWMVLTVLPVIPPDLRPMVQLEGGRFATSDLNDLYRRVINRNNRLKKLMDLGAPEVIIQNEKRMLQEAVDALIDSSRQKRPRPMRGKQELRSLSDMLRGKQGRFRQNLLGKRVDYSGRSVIVVGPQLKLDECGLPKEMALELFKPFVLREILVEGLAPNVKSAKYVLESRIPEVWDLLEKIVEKHPVLLNRAPTLHRLGIQAFYPRLIEGNAIQLHPCVCAGFNADFDGDQMAVHVPLSEKSRKEALEIMLSSKNLLKPSSGQPISVPERSMLVGMFYLTAMDESLEPWPHVLSEEEAIFIYQVGSLKLQQKAKIKFDGKIYETTVGRIIFNRCLPKSLRFFNEAASKKNNAAKGLVERCLKIEGDKMTATLIDDLKTLGFKYAMDSGISMAITDCKISPKREVLIAETEEKEAKIDRDFGRGLITEGEKKRLTVQAWVEATSKIDDLTWEGLEERNPVKILVNSGARGNRDQVKQIAGIRGHITDPTGKIVELPIKSNYRLGLSAFEYFASARGARKGFVDTALKTAEAGYLTRRLVDVAQEVVVREENCGTSEGVEFNREDKTILASFARRIAGRIVLKDIKKGSKVLVKAGEEITLEQAEAIEKAKNSSVWVRSVLTCETIYGVCAKCYGRDLGTGETVKVGTPVGVIAAQSIGEPGTQLTLRTRHVGGIITAKDVTQGLPRVEELFEARVPKIQAVISEIAGKVTVIDRKGGREVIIRAVEKDAEIPEAVYKIDPISEILVETGDLVGVGTPLTEGFLDPMELLGTVGVKKTQKYILNDVQEVYSSQGVFLDDKHIEIIIRQMFSKVKIDDPGDTKLLQGDIISRYALTLANEKALSEGKAPATAHLVLLGITRSSLATDSFLSAASFMETLRVLTEAAASGRVDPLLGLKENVIIGKLIPVGERATINRDFLSKRYEVY